VVDLLKTSPHILTLGTLGHIINCHSDDKDDVLQRRCNFMVQANNVKLHMISIKRYVTYLSHVYAALDILAL